MIDPDRDYLLTKVIDLNNLLIEYKQEFMRNAEQIGELQKKNASLVEANASALASAEGWKKQAEQWKKDYFEMLNAAAEWQGAYEKLLTAARRDAGWKNKRGYLRYLGLPTD